MTELMKIDVTAYRSRNGTTSGTTTPRIWRARRPQTTPLSTTTPRPLSSATSFCTCQSAKVSPRSTPMIPRSATPTFTQNHASWNGHDSTSPAYHSLINHWNLQGLQWIFCSEGQMPSRAVQGGHTRSGEPLYIARALTPGMNLCIGTFSPSTGRCHIWWRNREIRTDRYEILCYRSRWQGRTSIVYSATMPQLTDALKVMTLRNPLRIPKVRFAMKGMK